MQKQRARRIRCDGSEESIDTLYRCIKALHIDVCCGCTSSLFTVPSITYSICLLDQKQESIGQFTLPSCYPRFTLSTRTLRAMADAERVASAAEASTSGRDSAGAAPNTAPKAQLPAAPAPVVAFAKKARRGNIRKRPADADAEDAGGGGGKGSAVVRKQKARPDNPLAFSTKRPEEDKAELFKFESSGTLQQTTDQRATATLETETDFAHDARCAPVLSLGSLLVTEADALLSWLPSPLHCRDFLPVKMQCFSPKLHSEYNCLLPALEKCRG